MAILIGTAGWTVPRQNAVEFPSEGTSLERYAARLPVAEINSSFHRPHRISTWQRWHDSVPDDFRFSAKLPKTITHEAKLRDCSDLVGEFIDQIGALGDKLAVLLLQLPPKLELERDLVDTFFADLKSRSPAQLACEPRNASWFKPEADALLTKHKVARVAADPALAPEAAVPGGWRAFRYWRLHGSPLMYRSSYSDRISHYADQLLASAEPTWCIFDNTASSAATGDALALVAELRDRG